MAKKPAPIEVINDLDKEIVNFFEQLRINEKELCRLIALTPYAREELNQAREPKQDCSELERARRFLISSMFAINGVFGDDEGGFSYSDSFTRNGREARVSRWYNLPERVANVVERLRSVRIENKDATDLFVQYLQRPATLVYIDPPYLGERTNGYNHDEKSPEFHRKLLGLANRAHCMVFISGYSNHLYDELLTHERGWKCKIIETTTRGASGLTHKRTEVVWMNKYFQEACRTNELSLRLTKAETSEKKLNPLRKS